jgi:hypothetical protein
MTIRLEQEKGLTETRMIFVLENLIAAPEINGKGLGP